MKTIEEYKVEITLKMLAGELDGKDIRHLPIDDELRTLVCSFGPRYAYDYAFWVDNSRDDTRMASCKDPFYAFLYSKNIDQCPREDTREAVSGDPEHVYCYAYFVDKCSRDDTRGWACESSQYSYCYALNVDECARDDTRIAACRDPEYAYYYARDVDVCYREDTYQAVLEAPEYKEGYIKEFGETIVSNLEKENEKLRELLGKYLTKNPITKGN